MDKKLKVFLYVCFGISFIAGGAFHFLGGDLSSASGMFFASAYMLIPLISVIITQLIFGEKPFSDVGVSFKINKWWFVAWLLMPVVNILAMFASTLLPGVSLDPNSELVRLAIADMSTKGLEIDGWGLLAITIVGSLFAGFTINAFFCIWRRDCMARIPSTNYGCMGILEKIACYRNCLGILACSSCPYGAQLSGSSDSRSVYDGIVMCGYDTSLSLSS